MRESVRQPPFLLRIFFGSGVVSLLLWIAILTIVLIAGSQAYALLTF